MESRRAPAGGLAQGRGWRRWGWVPGGAAEAGGGAAEGRPRAAVAGGREARRGGLGGGGGRGRGQGGDGATSPRRSLRWSGCTSKRRFGSTAATARGRPRSSA